MKDRDQHTVEEKAGNCSEWGHCETECIKKQRKPANQMVLILLILYLYHLSTVDTVGKSSDLYPGSIVL